MEAISFSCLYCPRESTQVLIDAIANPKLHENIRNILKKYNAKVKVVRIRRLGNSFFCTPLYLRS
jgi:divalent metal cation (Fe/Co/Zn/Cd) transporter